MRTTLILRFPHLAPRPQWRMIWREEEEERWSRATLQPLQVPQRAMTNIATLANTPVAVVASPRQLHNRPIPLVQGASRGDTTMVGGNAPCIISSSTTWTMTPTQWSILPTNMVRCTSTSASTLDAIRYVCVYVYLI